MTVYVQGDQEILRGIASDIRSWADKENAEGGHYYHKSVIAPCNNKRYIQAAELLDLGVTKVDFQNFGTVINDRFVVATHSNKWRVMGSNTWYRHKGLKDFVKNYVEKDKAA